MQKQTVEIAVGIFFLLGIAAFIMLAFKVSGLADISFIKQGYHPTAEFENVGGLKPKARVSIAGVSIGRVTAIDFDKNEYTAKVHMTIDSKVNNIPDDSTASILTAGLLGDNYISLTPGYNTQYFKEGDNIAVTNTNKAVVLEELLSRFFANQASGFK